MRCQRDQLADALRGLVDRLDDVHIDPAYKAVWEIHQLHAGPYAGPTYVADLEKARAAAAAVEEKP
jgi:hypothetical protein